LALKYAVAALLFILATSWLADEIRDRLTDGSHVPPWLIYVLISLFLITSIYMLFISGKERRMVHLLKRGTESEPHKVLIALISAPHKAEYENQEGKHRVRLGDKQVDLSGELERDNQAITDTFDTFGEHWNWQQLLHMIRPHLGKLQKLVLVLSSGDHGSIKHKKDCEDFLRLYLPNEKIAVASDPDGIDFGDPHTVFTTVTRCIDEAVQEGFAAGDILVDVTGGTKPASVGAAFATLQHTEVEFQYVNNQGKPLSFNTTTVSYENKMAG
jgi:hypothetical protein